MQRIYLFFRLLTVCSAFAPSRIAPVSGRFPNRSLDNARTISWRFVAASSTSPTFREPMEDDASSRKDSTESSGSSISGATFNLIKAMVGTGGKYRQPDRVPSRSLPRLTSCFSSFSFRMQPSPCRQRWRLFPIILVVSDPPIGSYWCWESCRDIRFHSMVA